MVNVLLPLPTWSIYYSASNTSIITITTSSVITITTFTLFIATLALVSGIQKMDDINYDAHLDAGLSSGKASYKANKAARDVAVGAQAASDAWRGAKDPKIWPA